MLEILLIVDHQLEKVEILVIRVDRICTLSIAQVHMVLVVTPSITGIKQYGQTMHLIGMAG